MGSDRVFPPKESRCTFTIPGGWRWPTSWFRWSRASPGSTLRWEVLAAVPTPQAHPAMSPRMMSSTCSTAWGFTPGLIRKNCWRRRVLSNPAWDASCRAIRCARPERQSVNRRSFLWALRHCRQSADSLATVHQFQERGKADCRHFFQCHSLHFLVYADSRKGKRIVGAKPTKERLWRCR